MTIWDIINQLALIDQGKRTKHTSEAITLAIDTLQDWNNIYPDVEIKR